MEIQTEIEKAAKTVETFLGSSAGLMALLQVPEHLLRAAMLLVSQRRETEVLKARIEKLEDKISQQAAQIVNINDKKLK